MILWAGSAVSKNKWVVYLGGSDFALKIRIYLTTLGASCFEYILKLRTGSTLFFHDVLCTLDLIWKGQWFEISLEGKTFLKPSYNIEIKEYSDLFESSLIK